MIKMMEKFGINLSAEQADALMREWDISVPHTDKVRYGLDIEGEAARVIINVYDDGAECEWAINLASREICHRGYGVGCYWTDWESIK